MLTKLIRFVYKLPQRYKTRVKRKNFHKYAEIGRDLDIHSRADCKADKPGTIRIGDHCRIYGRLETQGDGRITIGEHCCIYLNTIIGSVRSIRIGNCVTISNHVHIYDNNNHPVDPDVRHKMCMEGFDGDAWKWTNADAAPVVIEDDVWICEYAAIMKGVTIGKGSVVAAHAVVTKDVPAYTMVAGNPARIIKEIKHEKT